MFGVCKEDLRKVKQSMRRSSGLRTGKGRTPARSQKAGRVRPLALFLSSFITSLSEPQIRNPHNHLLHTPLHARDMSNQYKLSNARTASGQRLHLLSGKKINARPPHQNNQPAQTSRVQGVCPHGDATHRPDNQNHTWTCVQNYRMNDGWYSQGN